VILLVALSGIIVGFGQPAWAPWLAPVSAVCGYALFWRAACKIQSGKRRFLLSTGWFFLVQLIQLSWMTSIEFQGTYILLVYALISIGLGLQFGVLSHVIDKIPFVASASIWALMECARLYFFCGFSFNPAGLALTAIPLSLPAVSIFGIFGLSFWVILTNLAVWKRRWKPAMVLALSPYLFGGALTWVYQPKIEKSPTLSVALVQTALLPSQKMYFPERAQDFISPYEQWERISKLLSKVDCPLDLVVLPEAAIPYTNETPLYSKERVARILQTAFQNYEPEGTDRMVSNPYWIHALSKILGADVIVGLDGAAGDVHYSSAFFASKGKIDRYDKQILLPLAEYLPFESLIQLTKKYGVSQFFAHGQGSKLFQSKVPISTSICYEETFGRIMRQGKKEGAALFVNVTNDNWYPHSRLPKQHFDLGKAQAVANGLPLVRACNAGVTAVVDSLGNEIASLNEWNKAGVLVAKVPIYSIWTLYSFWGDLGIIMLSMFFLTITLVINRKSYLF
jgi:apolipoprotein N-acyltransferase